MNLSKKEKTQVGLLALSCLIIVLGLTFLVNAMEVASFYGGFCAISNVLAKYLIVIGVMSCGIMLFSNVAVTVESDKYRNRLTIFITVFAFVLTLPLVYVFLAIFFAHNGIMGPVGRDIMMLDRIVAGFVAWFGSGAFIYVVYVFMLIVSIVFLLFPLVTGYLAVKGKALKVGKNENGKLISIIELPVLTKIKARANNDNT